MPPSGNSRFRAHFSPHGPAGFNLGGLSVSLRIAFGLLLALLGTLVCAAAPDQDRMVNVSTRARAGTGSETLIAGFVVGSGPAKPVLVRAVGPTLSLFGLSGLLADPSITLTDSKGAVIATNDNWSLASGVFFGDVGAFGLPTGSLDASLVATLAPGSYTAQVTGGTGLSIVEVYDVSGPARMSNISTRGYVGPGDQVMIAGIVNSTTLGKRRVLVRGVGPGLEPFKVAGVLANPVLTVFNDLGGEVAKNDDWDASLAEVFTAAGAFGLASASKDAALVLDLDAGAYTVHMTSQDGGSGVGLIEVYDLNPAAPAFIALAATTPTTRLGALPAAVTFTRTGDLSPALSIPIVVGGDAVPDQDYQALPATVDFLPGASTATLFIHALPTPGSGSHTVTVSVGPTASYAITGPATATASILTGESTLYVASLRPETSAGSSQASGSSFIQLSGDEHFLSLTLSFSNLSSSETVAYLRMYDGSGQVIDLRRLSSGQVESELWEISDVGSITVAEILAALKAGRVFVEVQTTAFPAGELSGRYATASGSTVFTPPAAPPDLPGGPPTPTDAARFLIQATFGPTQAEIDSLVTLGIPAWLDEQFLKTPSLHQVAIMDDFALYPPTPTSTKPNNGNRQSAWWKIVLKSDDQLRQRVAFALSELLVVADSNGNIGANQEAANHYYDLLVNHAFGNYRTLLDEVSRSPIIGTYLSSLRNAKADPKTGALADENYAREVMQLFTIGLWELQPDGTLRLDAKGAPIPTYDQTTITQMAKVFTGWGFYSTAAKPSFRGAPADWFTPMMMYPGYHDTTEKTIPGGVVLAAGRTGEQDLKDALDTLFNHPSTAPFVSKQLIQRLVTSNPSPAYVYRVASVFADNGAGVRGDLKAVVRAILTDYEARSSTVRGNTGFGKLKEPLLRVSALSRAFNGTSANARYPYVNPDTDLLQAVLRAPTVFNFFEPSYSPGGALSEAGLVGPEFQILNATTAITVTNRLYSFVYSAPAGITLDWASYVNLAATPAALVDSLDLVLTGGAATAAAKARIVTAIGAVPKSTTATDKVKLATYLLTTTSAAAVQH